MCCSLNFSLQIANTDPTKGGERQKGGRKIVARDMGGKEGKHKAPPTPGISHQLLNVTALMGVCLQIGLI